YTDAVSVAGISPGDSGTAQVTTIRDHATSGDFQFRASGDEAGGAARTGVVVGRLLAERLSAFPGARITIVTATGSEVSPLFGGMVPRFFEYEVTGVFETGMYEYDNAYVYMDLAAAQEFAGLDSAVTGIEVRTTDRWA